MRCEHSLVCVGVLAATLLLVSCSPGSNSTDVQPRAAATTTPVSGPDSFLLFPNPQQQPDGSLQTNTVAYATAYYEAIDPNNDKDTLAKWKAANGFGSSSGIEETVVFGDVRDLGYGRRMTARQNTDGTVAVMVENYLVTPAANYAYSSLNLDAAVVRDTRWFVNTTAIEFSPGPGGVENFAKFYAFSKTTGQRVLEANLDNRGNKAMPGICISCHGGRADPLTPAAGSPTRKALFALVMSSVSQKRGDVEAHLQPLEVGALDFSTTPSFTRANQEAAIKSINQMVLCTYPLPASAPAGFAEDACRRPASAAEWQGTAAVLIKNAYGGNGLPNATFSDTYAGDALPDAYPSSAVPTTSWASNGQLTLYKNVIVPSCRTCHIVRGTGRQSDINLDSFAAAGLSGSGFKGYADRIKAHIVDRGNMPLAKIVADEYYGTSNADLMATFIESVGMGFVARDSNGVVLKPGRPIADPGPGRVVTMGATQLTAAASLYATTYAWSLISNPGGGVLTNPNSATPIFTATVNGSYLVQLIASNGSIQSTPATLTLVVNSALSPAPAAIRFADIKAVLAGCATCHALNGAPISGTPIYFTNMDRNGDAVVDATDDLWFYTELRGRINFTDIVASPLLRKPSHHHHAGTMQTTNFDDSLTPGAAGRANYDLFLNWILNGAPQ